MEKETVTNPDGKVIETTKHADGRKSVVVNVKSLDIDDTDPESLEAKTMIEDKVLTHLGEQKVHVIVLHKPTNQSTHAFVKLLEVRKYAETVVAGFPTPAQQLNSEPQDNFAIIEINDGEVSITTL